MVVSVNSRYPQGNQHCDWRMASVDEIHRLGASRTWPPAMPQAFRRWSATDRIRRDWPNS